MIVSTAKDFGSAIRARRKELGLTQIDIGRASDPHHFT